MVNIVGWDIGAVNVKAALCCPGKNKISPSSVIAQPIEIWREKDDLEPVLLSVFESITSSARAMAVTMTAELSDAFETKREGVRFVLQALEACFPSVPVYVFSLSGEFIPLSLARTRPLEFVASNWLATATWVCKQVPDCLVVDVGSTTTDIVPIVAGRVETVSRTDLDRLGSGELIYTGALRTNLAAIASSVPVRGRFRRVASECFAISGDVHLILGNISVDDYRCATPDGRPPSIDSARKRVARLVCADAEMLSCPEIVEIARFVHNRQVRQISEGIEQIISRFPGLRNGPVILFGSGHFLAETAVRELGLKIERLTIELGSEQLAVAPCVAVAQLLCDCLGEF